MPVKSVVTVLKNNLGFLFAMLLMFSVRSSLADWYHIPSGSMLPTVEVGDRVLVDKTAYRLEAPFTDTLLMQTGLPAHGDIVVFESAAAGERLIKRVIGLPGDTVAMHQHRLTVNGESFTYMQQQSQLLETDLQGNTYAIAINTTHDRLANFNPVTVPQGFVLVLGDNRSHSADSRVHGFIPVAEIKGKAVRVVVSIDKHHHYLPRGQRFWLPLGQVQQQEEKI